MTEYKSKLQPLSERSRFQEAVRKLSPLDAGEAMDLIERLMVALWWHSCGASACGTPWEGESEGWPDVVEYEVWNFMQEREPADGK